MTTATRRRRRRNAKPTTAPSTSSRTVWAVVHNGNTIRETEWGDGPALSAATNLIWSLDAPTELTVERRDLFGPAAKLYRLTLDPTGKAVGIHTLARED